MRRADNFTTFMCRLSGNLKASASWNPQGRSISEQGSLYLLISVKFSRWHMRHNFITFTSILFYVGYTCISVCFCVYTIATDDLLVCHRGISTSVRVIDYCVERLVHPLPENNCGCRPSKKANQKTSSVISATHVQSLT